MINQLRPQLPIHKTALGQTGILVSKLGIGTVKFGRNTGVKYPYHFNIPEDHTLKELLATAKELNINLLDTAPAYGSSEERLGQLLKNERHAWIICSKVGEKFANDISIFNYSKEYIINSIHQSLKRLHTDYLDILLIHSNGQEDFIINKDQVFITLADLKKQGLIRTFGMSCKTVEGGIATVKLADVAMVTLNLNHLADLPVIEEAKKLSKGILIKKPLNNGYLPVKPSMDFIFKNPKIQGINSVILGTINAQHLLEVANYVS
jgi:aryl-alcohol dehydrogenase-like predicted oxidoreductase